MNTVNVERHACVSMSSQCEAQADEQSRLSFAVASLRIPASNGTVNALHSLALHSRFVNPTNQRHSPAELVGIAVFADGSAAPQLTVIFVVTVHTSSLPPISSISLGPGTKSPDASQLTCKREAPFIASADWKHRRNRHHCREIRSPYIQDASGQQDRNPRKRQRNE